MKNSTQNDAQILALKAKIEEKKNNLKKLSKFIPLTNLSLELYNVRYNLNVLNKDQLLFLLGTLRACQAQVSNVINVSGYSIADWCSDILAKYDMLDVKAEETRLKELETKLHNLLSNDTKVELELSDLEKQIGA